MTKNIIYAPTGSPLHFDIDNKPMGGADKVLVRWIQNSNSNNEFFVNCKPNTTLYPNMFNYEHLADLEHDCDTLIMYRVATAVPRNVRYNRLIFYSQDDVDAPCLNKVDSSYFKMFDKIIVLSEYHKKQFMECLFIPENKIVIIGNYASEHFYNQEIDRENKIIFCSTPFRGVHVLARIWNKYLKDKLKDYTLEIYSGMQTYGLNNQMFDEIFRKIEGIERINLYDPVGEIELSKAMNESKLLFYPNTFPETYCNVLDEAILSGLNVVVSDSGCLSERVGDCGKVVKGEPYSTLTQLNLAEAVINELARFDIAKRNRCRIYEHWFNDMKEQGLIE